MKNNVLINVALFILLAISIGVNIGQAYHIKTIGERDFKLDSVMVDTVISYLHNFDTVYVTKFYQGPTQYVYDTIHVQNKVYIRDTVQAYEFREKDYDLAIGAVKLDYYKLDIHTTDSVRIAAPVLRENKKEKRWNVGLQAGAGYGLFNNKPDIYVGMGITYKIN